MDYFPNHFQNEYFPTHFQIFHLLILPGVVYVLQQGRHGEYGQLF